MVLGNASPKLINNVISIARARRALPFGTPSRRVAGWACSPQRRNAETLLLRRFPIEWKRGAKRRSALKLDSLPQGSIGVKEEERVLENEEVEYPTVVQQALNNMRKFDHCVLLTRVGGFYEVCVCHLYCSLSSDFN